MIVPQLHITRIELNLPNTPNELISNKIISASSMDVDCIQLLHPYLIVDDTEIDIETLSTVTKNDSECL